MLEAWLHTQCSLRSSVACNSCAAKLLRVCPPLRCIYIETDTIAIEDSFATKAQMKTHLQLSLNEDSFATKARMQTHLQLSLNEDSFATKARIQTHLQLTRD